MHINGNCSNDAEYFLYENGHFYRYCFLELANVSLLWITTIIIGENMIYKCGKNGRLSVTAPVSTWLQIMLKCSAAAIYGEVLPCLHFPVSTVFQKTIRIPVKDELFPPYNHFPTNEISQDSHCSVAIPT